MGIMRLLWRSSPITAGYALAKAMVQEKSVVKGYKKVLKETYTEDFPLTAAFYKAGKKSGYKEGYESASNEYQQKLLQQADEFLSQKEILKKDIEKYQKLLDECDKEIERLTSENSRTKQENEYLKLLLEKQEQLKKMKV